jgi:hypothetical protein
VAWNLYGRELVGEQSIVAAAIYAAEKSKENIEA